MMRKSQSWRANRHQKKSVKKMKSSSAIKELIQKLKKMKMRMTMMKRKIMKSISTPTSRISGSRPSLTY